MTNVPVAHSFDIIRVARLASVPAREMDAFSWLVGLF